METEIHEHTSQQTMDLKEFAAKNGVDPRTVKTWLAKGQVPDAFKDPFTRQWRFPDHATRQQQAVVDTPATSNGQQLAVSPPNGTMMLPPAWFPHAEGTSEMTRLERLDEAGGYLTIKEAAEFLHIPQKRILENPEEFRLKPFGIKDSLVVPKAVVREIEGK
jgi:hypothetical protein